MKDSHLKKVWEGKCHSKVDRKAQEHYILLPMENVMPPQILEEESCQDGSAPRRCMRVAGASQIEIPPSTLKTSTKWMGCGMKTWNYLVKFDFSKLEGVKGEFARVVKIHSYTFCPHFGKHECQ